MIHLIVDGKQVCSSAWFIPDGTYRAVWAGQCVAFEVDRKLYRATAKKSAKARTECRIRITGGNWRVL